MASLDVEAQRIAAAYKAPSTGRPSVLGDAETLQELLRQVALGNRREVACAIAGIAPRTVYNWIERADAGHEPELSFVQQLKRAEAMVESRIAQNVISASEKPQFWAAGMTYLERKYPDAWGRRSEDGNSPRIVVQIGVKDSDVRVNLVEGSAPKELPETC